MKKYFAILVAVVALVATTAPAWAQAEAPGASFTVIGRLWTDFGYQYKSEELATNHYAFDMKGRLRDSYTSNFVQLNANSYFGAKWTSGDKSTGAHAELYVQSGQVGAPSKEAVGLRYAYGWWKAGKCKIVAGHTDGVFGSLFAAPGQMLGTNQSSKVLLLRWGYLYSGRYPQVRFEYTSPVGLLSIALGQAGAEQVPGLQVLTVGGATVGTSQAYFALPRADLAWAIRLGSFMAIPGFSISQMKYDGVSSGRDDTVVNWVVQVPLSWSSAGFGVKAQAYYGQNIDCEWGQVGTTAFSGSGFAMPQPQAIPVWDSNGKVEDSMQWGATLELSYTVGQWKPLLGFGYVYTNNDNWKKAGYREDNFSRWSAFAAINYRINKYFTVQPEVAYFNYGDVMHQKYTDLTGKTQSSDYGTEWLFGVVFLFVF